MKLSNGNSAHSATTGEHYVYDLLLTVPFLWAVDSAASLVMRMK